MPFRSDKQRAYLYKFHPKIAKRWRRESGPQTDLPTYVKGGKKESKAVKGLKNAKP